MIQAPPRFPWKEQRVQSDLFISREPILDLAEESAIDQRADPADQAIEGAKGWEFSLVFAQRLQRDIDQVGRIVHDLGSTLNCHCGNVAHRHPTGEDAQAFANEAIVGIQCARRHQRCGQRGELERRADVVNDRRQDLVERRKIAEMLEGLEEQRRTEGRVITAGDALEPCPFVVSQGILGLDFLRGEEAVIAGVGGAFDGCHMGPDPFLCTVLWVAVAMSAMLE
jgi:hypothetical protein